jgi:hypothetical protein
VAWARRAARARHRAMPGRQDLTGRQGARRLVERAPGMDPRSRDAVVRRDCAAADSRSRPELDDRGWSRRGQAPERTARQVLRAWGRWAAQTERLPIAWGELVWRGKDLKKSLVWNRAKYRPMFSNSPWRRESADPGWLRMIRGLVRSETRIRRRVAEDRCDVDPGAGPRPRLRAMAAVERAVLRSASYPGMKEVQARLGSA